MQTTQAEVSGSLIDLAIGHPSPRLLPLELLREAAASRLGQDDRSFLQYGFEQGDSRFRTALSAFLADCCGVRLAPAELFVSGGASQALDLICTVFTRPGQLVLAEEPTYFLALRIFADHGLRVASVPTDEHGLVVEALEERLAEERPAFLYTVPTHQNPTGRTLPRARREDLLRLGRERDLLIVSDEAYHLLSYAGQAPLTLAAHIGGAKLLSLGSFSKILAPGLRIGWIAAAPELLQPLATCGFLDSGGGLAPFASAIVRSAMDSGALAEHVHVLRGVYGERAAAMTGALRRNLGAEADFTPPSGGFFHWLDLGPGRESERLLPLARKRGVSFVPGNRFSPSGGQTTRLRLSFSYYDAPRIEEGVTRLAEALGDWATGPSR